MGITVGSSNVMRQERILTCSEIPCIKAVCLNAHISNIEDTLCRQKATMIRRGR